MQIESILMRPTYFGSPEFFCFCYGSFNCSLIDSPLTSFRAPRAMNGPQYEGLTKADNS